MVSSLVAVGFACARPAVGRRRLSTVNVRARARAACVYVLVRVASSCSCASRRAWQRLARLPCLVELSFQDIHFGPCPVAQLDGYRDSVLTGLRSLRQLDGLEVIGCLNE